MPHSRIQDTHAPLPLRHNAKIPPHKPLLGPPPQLILIPKLQPIDHTGTRQLHGLQTHTLAPEFFGPIEVPATTFRVGVIARHAVSARGAVHGVEKGLGVERPDADRLPRGDGDAVGAPRDGEPEAEVAEIREVVQAGETGDEDVFEVCVVVCGVHVESLAFGWKMDGLQEEGADTVVERVIIAGDNKS
jgi:hypothetical protein